MRARRLGLTMSQLPSLDAGGAAVQLAPVSVEDLLLRPSVKIDYRRLEQFVAGKSIVVTGGGGSIGSEICERIVAFGAARLLVIENSEPALHAVLEQLASREAAAEISGHIADIRDRARIMHLIASFKPDIVFHAAALKHVPILERDWDEGVKTNVLGSINVADAAAAAGCDSDGDDLDRQGDRAGVGAGRDQAAGGNVLRGARRRSAPRRRRPRRAQCG